MTSHSAFNNSNRLYLTGIPQCGISTEFDTSVSSENPMYYRYKNITRVAIIINMLKRVTVPRTVDDVFKLYFERFEDTKEIISLFLRNLDDFLVMYIRMKFPNVESIIASNSTELVVDYYPVFSWMEQGVIFVSYDATRLEELLNKYNSLFFIGSSTFITDKNIYEEADLNTLKHTYRNTATRVLDSLLSKNYPQVDCIDRRNEKDVRNFRYSGVNAKCMERQSYDANTFGENSDQIQKNLNEIWKDENETKLTTLIVLSEILENSIRPLIEEQLSVGGGGQIENTKIKVSFPKKKNSHFTFDKTRLNNSRAETFIV